MTETTKINGTEDELSRFLQEDREWLCSLIQQYPKKIPIRPIADHWGCATDSIRAAIEQDSAFGIHWRKNNAKNHSYLIPTGVFIQWYCKVKF